MLTDPSSSSGPDPLSTGAGAGQASVLASGAAKRSARNESAGAESTFFQSSLLILSFDTLRCAPTRPATTGGAYNVSSSCWLTNPSCVFTINGPAKQCCGVNAGPEQSRKPPSSSEFHHPRNQRVARSIWSLALRQRFCDLQLVLEPHMSGWSVELQASAAPSTSSRRPAFQVSRRYSPAP
jgi:hypothetical protein